jgi:hypothetical protein
MKRTPQNIGRNPVNLSKVHRSAYNALPSGYKSDRALDFYIDSQGNTCAEHVDEKSEYVFKRNKWIRIR